jgi:hypothetical protein
MNTKPTIMSLIQVIVLLFLVLPLVLSDCKGGDQGKCVPVADENEKLPRLGVFIVIVTMFIICCNRRPLTMGEHVRFNYDPVFRYRYITGKI